MAAKKEAAAAATSLAAKLIEIAQKIGYIQKKGTNEALDYKYVGDAQVVETLRGEFLDRGILVIPNHTIFNVFPIERGSKAANIVTTIQSAFTFINAEDGDTLTVTTVGQGTDTGDKGAFKAMTGSRKYALLQALMIATGDDPEETRDDEREAVGQKTGGEAAATPAQKQKLHAQGKKVNLEGDDLRKFVFKITGKNRSEDLTKDDMKKLFENMDVLEASGGKLVD